MQENKNQLLSFAMFSGIYLGIFWIVKYLFVIGGSNVPLLNVVSTILGIGTPLLLYYYLVKYKTTVIPDGNMGYWHGVQFGIMLFFFASLFEAIIVFIHVKWIDPTYIGSLYDNMVEVVGNMKFGQKWTSAIAEQPKPTPFDYIFNNVILNDVFIGLLLSLILVPAVSRFAPNNAEETPTKKAE